MTRSQLQFSIIYFKNPHYFEKSYLFLCCMLVYYFSFLNHFQKISKEVYTLKKDFFFGQKCREKRAGMVAHFFLFSPQTHNVCLTAANLSTFAKFFIRILEPKPLIANLINTFGDDKYTRKNST